MSDSDEESARLAALRTVRSAHTGAEFESGEWHERPGRNEPAPGVDVVGSRDESESTWSGGRQNFSNKSGRRRRLADTPNSKTVPDPRRGRTGMLTVFQSKDAIEDERWVYIIQYKDNGSKVFLCIACGKEFTGSQEKVINHKLQLGGIVEKCPKVPDAECRRILEKAKAEREAAKNRSGYLGSSSTSKSPAVAKSPPIQSMLGGSFTTREQNADAALARWCAAHDVPWAAVCQRDTLWCDVVSTIQLAGPSYKPARREILSDDKERSGASRAGGLHLALTKMETDKQKVLSAAASEGGTLVSDGAKLSSRKRGMLNTGLETRLGSIFLQQTDATGKKKDGEFLCADYLSAIKKAGPLTTVKKVLPDGMIVTKQKSEIVKLLVTDRGGGCVRALQLIEEILIILTDTCKGHGADLLIEDWAKPFKPHLKQV
jgi:hypothetical protein